MSIKAKCPNCGSTNLSSPQISLVNTGPAIDGRLRMNEIVPRFVVGCNDCSETIAVLHEDQVEIKVKQ